MSERMDLQGLTEARGASFNEGRICLANTRQNALGRILHWVEDSTACGVYWLTGVAGSGKSTIAHTVAKLLADRHRLGASFFFDRNDAALSSPHLFCTTIARQLARYSPEIRQAILEAVKRDPGIDSKPLANQMAPLILATVKKAHLTVPLVMVFDAFDESGSPEGRKEFMAMLRRELPELSAHVKVLITGRDEADIRSALPSDCTRQPHRADVNNETRGDIFLYIQSQLKDIPLRDPYLQHWPSEEELHQLVRRTDGLFIWARVACDFILSGPRHDPRVHLKMILSANPVERALAEGSLDSLYITVLRRMTSINDNRARNEFRYVIGSIIALGDPLAPRHLDRLLGLEQKNVEQPLALPDGTEAHLSSSAGLTTSLATILAVDGTDKPVRIIHASIFDFFVNEERSREFYIDLQVVHHLLFDRCISRMRSLLQYDICDLQDPSKFNRDIPDIDNRIDSCIPNDLRYACRFWAFHLTQMKDPMGKVESVATGFLSRHFLHWIEVMSLLGCARDVAQVLHKVQIWAKVCLMFE